MFGRNQREVLDGSTRIDHPGRGDVGIGTDHEDDWGLLDVRENVQDLGDVAAEALLAHDSEAPRSTVRATRRTRVRPGKQTDVLLVDGLRREPPDGAA